MKGKIALALGALCVVLLGWTQVEWPEMEPEDTPQTVGLEPFRAHYQATYKIGWFSLNIEGVRTLSALDDQRWLLTFEASTTGASLSERSIFKLENGQIIPKEYQYSTAGLLNKDSLHQRFHTEQGVIEDVLQKKMYADTWQPGVQDDLTYILQASLDLAAGKTDLYYDFFQKNSLRSYHYQVVAEELLNTAVGELKTLKLERKDSENRKIFAWFAVEHNYQLVRLAEYKKGKIAYEITLSKLSD